MGQLRQTEANVAPGGEKVGEIFEERARRAVVTARPVVASIVRPVVQSSAAERIRRPKRVFARVDPSRETETRLRDACLASNYHRIWSSSYGKAASGWHWN